VLAFGAAAHRNADVNRPSTPGRRRIGTLALALCGVLLIVGAEAAQGPRVRPKRSVDDLKALLRDPAQSDRARIRAASLLGEHEDPRAEAILVEALGDAKAAVRFGAARALGRPGRSASVEPLVKLLSAPGEPPLVRGAAARSLGAIGDAGAVPALLAARQATPAEVRVAARQALLTLPPAIAPLARPELLIEILTDAEAPESARSAAALELSETQDPRRIPLLVAALEAPAPANPPAAPATAADLISARTEARRSLPATAARALGQLGAKEAVPSLVRAAAGHRGEVRAAALEALARLRAPEATAVAVECLGDPDPRPRRWAALLLGEVEAREALGHLRSALEDSDEGVRLQAIRGLVRMNDSTAVDQLAHALEREAVPHVREALQEALAVLAPLAAL
jgi:HEAT repeat protein